MKIKYSPQRNDKQIQHKFNNDTVQIIVEQTSYVYDFSDLTDGQMTTATEHIVSAKRVDGELSVELINYIGPNATDDEQFPQWQTVNQLHELNVNAQVVEVEWITQEELDAIANAPKPPTVDDRIEQLENMLIMMMEVM